MQVLTGALGAVGNPEAQAALVSAIKARPTDWPALSMLIPALDEASVPTLLAEETIQELGRQSQNPDIASTAQLTLGSMARNLAETSPERATSIVDSLIKQIDSSASADTTRQLLLALGNAGSAQAYPTVVRFMTDSSPALRGAAASALRWVASDRVDAQLTSVLTSDPEATVRREAAIALGFRQMTNDSFEAQKRAFLADQDDKVRLTLLRNLWKAQQAFPEALKLVKGAAMNDASQDVRKAATDILATNQEIDAK
jgi:HEAT repeat protein